MNDLVEIQASVMVAQDDIRSRIHTIRGVQVILDSDLAMLYRVETRVFNQAVKRNAERFPENFRFQLTAEEHRLLLSQIVTAKRERGVETRGGQHNRPFVFTEQGIAMLAGVLKSDVAVQASIRGLKDLYRSRHKRRLALHGETRSGRLRGMGNLTRAAYANQRMTLYRKLRQSKRTKRNTMIALRGAIHVACFHHSCFVSGSYRCLTKTWMNGNTPHLFAAQKRWCQMAR